MLAPRNADVFRALSNGYKVQESCLAYRVNGTTRTRVELPLVITGGDVTMTAGTGTRSVLSCDFAPAAGLRKALGPGLLLRPSWRIRWGAHGEETVTWGEFLTDEQSITYGESGSIRVTAPDTWKRVAGFPLRAQAPDGDPETIAAQWVREAHGDLAGELLDGNRRRVYGRLYEKDRDAAIRDLLNAVGMQAYLDRQRRLVITDRPDLGTATPRWEVTATGREATFLDGTATRSSRDVINSYSVHPDRPGAFRPFAVQDTDPRSPTSIQRLGVQSSGEPLIFPGADRDTAAIAAKARLRATTSMAFTTSITAAANPFIDPDDAGLATLPEQGGDPEVTEKVFVERVVHPLLYGEPMQMDLRSHAPLVDLTAAAA